MDKRKLSPEEDAQASARLAEFELATKIVGDKPNSLECATAAYFLSLKDDVNISGERFITFIRDRQSWVRRKDIISLWKMLKMYASQHEGPFQKGFMDIPLLTPDDIPALSRGENAPQASAEQGETEKPKAKRNRPIEIEDNEGDNNTIGDGSSGSSGDSRSSGGSGSSSTLTATRQKKMKEEYHRNFNDFSEPSWVLPSGTNVDTVIYRHVHALRKESLLHSFVISRVQTVKDLFSNDDDKNAIAQELARKKKRSDGPVVDVETAFISSYLSTPLETQTALSRGWLTSDSTLDDPSKMSLYHSMMQIFMTYHQEGLKLSTSRSESWYITKLWAFLPTILMMSGRLDHQPGEITSDASALRKNADRDLESRKFQGRKLDGMISCTITNLELGAIEAAKIDTGLQGTKSLTDSRKLGKVMKDMHDRVAAKAREDIRNKLETFGLLISRNTVTLFTLRRLPGRHYQLVNGGSYTFPTTWDARGLGAKAIIDLLVRLTIFKSDIEDMADKVIEWTQPGVGGVETDVLVRTLTTPLPSPKAEKSSYL